MSSERHDLVGTRSVLTPLRPEHAPEVRRILATPEVARHWGSEEARRPGWPFDDPQAHRFAVVVEGRVSGLAQYYEEDDPRYRYASIDLFLDPAIHNQGVGRDVVGTLARYLFDEAGHHRIVIDPAADNTAAVRCYQAARFGVVGVMRQYERDTEGTGWHDGLLMERLASDDQ
jgi:aminoglycoside 6'-N-acetyltransferase